MKYITTILFLLLGILEINAQMVRPIESESMYKQLRSMEDGPWEFAPDAYYYSWVRRSDRIGFIKWSWDVPGLGVHDRGFAGSGVLGDRYVSKYKPSGQVRAKMIALTELSRKYYESIAEKYKDIGERELIDATDRQVNLAIKLYEDRIKTMYSNIKLLSNLHDQYRGVKQTLIFRDELARIQSNISLIGKSYIRNAERTQAYLKELNNLERLSKKLKISCKRAFIEQEISKQKLTI